MNDKFGIKMLYETKGGAPEWYCDAWKNGKTRKLYDGKVDPYDSRFTFSNGSPNVPLQLNGDGAARFRTSIVCSSARLWASGSWLNTEMTCEVIQIKTIQDVQMRSRANHLISGAEPQCTFGNYVIAYRADKKITLAVELFHPVYKRYIVQKSFDGIVKGKYMGFKTVTRTKDGNKVHLEGYINANGDKQTWSKTIEFTFDGSNVTPVLTDKEESYRKQCVDKGDKVANDLKKSCCWLKEGKYCWIRINECTDFNVRNFSVREIEPET